MTNYARLSPKTKQFHALSGYTEETPYDQKCGTHDEQCKIVLLTLSCEGKKHDKKVSDETGFELPSGSCLLQDTGF